MSDSLSVEYQCFQNKVCVITGAFQGIGLEVANQILQQGGIVVGLDIHYEHAYLNEINPNYFSIHCDITNECLIDAAIAQIKSEFQAIDYFVNVAGILEVSALLDFQSEKLKRLFDVNTFGSFYITKEIAKCMQKKQSGNIVVVSSNAGDTPRLNIGGYGASKSALTMLVKCLALELAPFNVRCNIVSPGSTSTNMQHEFANTDEKKRSIIKGSLESYRLGIPLNKIGLPEEVAHSILFLLSNHASHITMHNLKVDAGATLG